jgi:nucleotide-binding universal stress UspA family protein
MIVVHNILVATDLGVASEAALLYGRTLARRFGARLHVIHVLDNVFMRATFADPRAVEASARKRLDDRLTDDDRVTLRATAVTKRADTPAEEIVAYAKAENIDFIVVGTHGRAGVPHFLIGSVAERVVRTAPCPVLTVRHPEHEFVRTDQPVGTSTAAKGADWA